MTPVLCQYNEWNKVLMHILFMDVTRLLIIYYLILLSSFKLLYFYVPLYLGYWSLGCSLVDRRSASKQLS